MSNWIKAQCNRPKVAEALKFVKILRVEPFLFVMIFQFALRGMPNFQIIQDKICMQWYNTSYDYCRDLPSINEEDSGPGHYKTRILSDTIQITSYVTYVELFPSLIWGLFIGAWIDRFNKGRKWLLILFCLAGMIENLISIYLTVNFDATPYINVFMTIPTLLLAGGGTGPRIAVTHYMTSTTPPKLMAIRFMLFEICLTLALPIGSAVAGFIIVRNPAFPTGQTRNFTVIYIISLVIDVFVLLWVIFMINERVAQQQKTDVETKLQEQCENEDAKALVQSDTKDEDKNIHPMKLLFSLENAKSMIRLVLKRRPNKGRKQILLITLALSIIFGEQIALTTLNSQFIQRVYLWKPDYSAYMNAIGMVIASIATMTIVPIMTRVFNVWDVSLAIAGYWINFTVNIIKGSWLSENAYYLTMVIVGGGMASICTRSHIAKIVDRNEQGKMMGVLAIMDSISPVIATTIFSQIFKVTVESQPGTVYYVIAGLIIIPILVMTWIYFRTERQIIDGINNQGANVGTNEEQPQNGNEFSKTEDGDC